MRLNSNAVFTNINFGHDLYFVVTLQQDDERNELLV